MTLPKVGDRVVFVGYGGHQVGTVERIGPKRVTLAYSSTAERPHVMRRAYPYTAFYQDAAGAWHAGYEMRPA